MKIQRVKAALAVTCILAAGTFYGISRNRDVLIQAGQMPVTVEEAKGVTREPGQDSFSDEEGQDAEDQAQAMQPQDQTAQAQAMQWETPAAGSAAQETRLLCYVHICGEVKSPGVYEMAAGSRVFEAVEAAGGFTPEAAEEYLNLAEAVGDGMKIVVPSEKELQEAMAQKDAAPVAAGTISGLVGNSPGISGGSGVMAKDAGSGDTGKVNLNTAAKEELMTLTGVGQARAEDIIRYREEHGAFQKIEDIMKISGIKDASFQKIKDKITV